MTQEEWARQLLARLGIKATTANVTALKAWMAAEGGHWHNTAYYNPLNTTQSEPGARSMNSVGVKAYTSWDQGLNATVTTLKNGHYGKILAALKSGSAKQIVQAVVNSVWGTKHISLDGVTASAAANAAANAGAENATSSGGGGLLSWPSEIVNFFQGTTDALTSAAEFFAAFFKPSTYVRIGAGFGGFLFIIIGLIALGMSAAKDN